MNLFNNLKLKLCAYLTRNLDQCQQQFYYMQRIFSLLRMHHLFNLYERVALSNNCQIHCLITLQFWNSFTNHTLQVNILFVNYFTLKDKDVFDVKQYGMENRALHSSLFFLLSKYVGWWFFFIFLIYVGKTFYIITMQQQNNNRKQKEMHISTALLINLTSLLSKQKKIGRWT